MCRVPKLILLPMSEPHQTKKYGTKWERDESILALYLYCQIPFAKTKANNPEVIHLAQIIGRTPGSVSRKLGNFGAFDPLLQSRGISGLIHVSHQDRAIWDEFHGSWERLVEIADSILSELNSDSVKSPQVFKPNDIDDRQTERPITRMQRLCQSFFRKTVLASYDNTCCICGLDIPRLLVASHIIPWAVREDCRTAPENGLSLCSLHDRAFDAGLIAVSESNSILVSDTLARSRSKAVNDYLLCYAGRQLNMPRRFPPHSENLNWHLKNIFQG